MTNTENQPDGPAVLSTAMLERIDDLAQWFTDNQNHGDIKDGLTVLVRDVAFAEREACKAACRQVASDWAKHGSMPVFEKAALACCEAIDERST